MTIEQLLQSVDAEIAKWQKLDTAIRAIFQPSPKPVVHGAAVDVADAGEIRKPIVRATVWQNVPVKRKLSAKGRAAIVAAAKKRWAKAKKPAKK